MTTISLKEFYEKITKAGLYEDIVIEHPKEEDVRFHFIKVLGTGASSYVFLARKNKNLVAVRMSYEGSNFTQKFQTVKRIMGEDYKKYLLEYIDSSIPIDYYIEKGEKGSERTSFDQKVFISTWEVANAVLKDKLSASFKNKLEWFSQFLKGLSVIHSRDRIHLDIKLDSLFVVGSQLKIGDFEYYLKTKDFLKSDILYVGTPGYIAPEMFYDKENISTKADIFSAGVAFCELFTGSKPEDFPLGRELSKEDKEEFQNTFGDKHLTIVNEDIKKASIINFKIFNFFIKEAKRKLESDKITEEERTVYNLLLEMVEIDPKKRIDVNRLLHKIHQVVFDPEIKIGKVFVDRFKIVDLKNNEGRGIIYKVMDKTENVSKAIKLFPPQFNFIKGGFDQIMDELTLARNITHRNVVNVYSLEKEGDLNFIVMEYIDGYNLKQKLDAEPRKKLKETEALFYMRQVASGLMEAQRNGVIHRNLKLENIMIKAEDNNIKIINFGLSRKIRNSISVITGEVYGHSSMLYLPPEQLQEIKGQENEQIDVWSFGAIFYQMLTGKPPFAEGDEIRDTNKLPPIKGVTTKTKAVVLKCLERDREDRYRNMNEVYNDLFGEKVSPVDTIAVKDNQKWKKVIPFLIGVIVAVSVIFLWGKFYQGIDAGKQTYRMWYSGFPGDADTPGGSIGYAESTNGIDWKRSKNNPVIPPGNRGSFNESESSFPYIVHDGISFHMLFRGRGGEKGLDIQIGHTTSMDGKDWKMNAIRVVRLDGGNISSIGPLLYVDGIYEMWYSENDEIYYAATKNANSSIANMVLTKNEPVIKKDEGTAWDKDGVSVGSVLFEGGVYKMWYAGKSGDESKIGYAVSFDGEVWKKYAQNPVFDDETTSMETNPCIVHDAREYKMYYTVKAGDDYYPVRLATSADGITWKKYSDIPVLDTGEQTWEKSKVIVTKVEIMKKEETTEKNKN